ncbi:ketopantoate reductase family protein [Campylobacter geochelonis]|uniref:ketopantoate reductase family protein n=1 Tax=Campylobacter geochelonis TaxID=1780362 RepID=UPI000770A1BF|nr:ketopantoate reductase family protein [Campylobacter geochelonis]CZE48742.1 2-dehydropantoate 2-reductase [Campylobacter geochelonis]
MKIQKITILGAGALGLMFGKKLSEFYGNDNVKFLADDERKKRYLKDGFMVNGKSFFPNFISNLDDKVDFLIVALKANALEDGLCLAKSFVSKKTIVISLLNGVTSEEIIAKTLNLAPLFCVAQGMDATKIKRELSYTKEGAIVIGEKDKSISNRLNGIKECLQNAGICVEIAGDIVLHQWSKFMLNCGVNQVLAIYKAPYELIQKDSDERKLMIEVMEEVRSLAVRMGINLGKNDIKKWLDIIDSLNPKGYPSMVQDVLAKRKTEVEIFAKTAVELGDKFGIKMPLNKMLYEKIVNLEKSF